MARTKGAKDKKPRKKKALIKAGTKKNNRGVAYIAISTKTRS
jgi:hypothetical protein